MLKLKKILQHLPEIRIRGSKEIDITGISCHSKIMAPGHLFIAKKGIHVDGSLYVDEAVNAGASAILTDLYNPFLPSHITQLLCPHVEEIEAKIASIYYENPSKELFLCGITGTNGKTTTSFLVRHLLSSPYSPCGLIGTIEWAIGSKIQPSSHTTPDVITNHKLLREMVRENCKSACMEVSSHALAQQRVRELHFKMGIFTNLTQDHLDYHQTMENYAKTKASFFSTLDNTAVALFNIDDPYTPIMQKECIATHLTYGLNSHSTFCAHDIALGVEGTVFTLTYNGKSSRIYSPLIGKHNVYNLLAAIGTAIIYGMSIEEIEYKIRLFPSVPGRLEKVDNPLGLSIFVDYAHTEDALENVLTTLQHLRTKSSRILLVFGCGGDRDKGKRVKMGKVASTLADFSVITSDNPRTENPMKIIEEICRGYETSSYVIEVDRQQAIEKMISLAKKEDLILIAGKGHERYQLIGQRSIPFDDRELAYRATLEKIR